MQLEVEVVIFGQTERAFLSVLFVFFLLFVLFVSEFPMEHLCY
jgi:hypothetical protein